MNEEADKINKTDLLNLEDIEIMKLWNKIMGLEISFI